jgi:hypothetical protein
LFPEACPGVSVIALHHRGWIVEEIANTMKRAKGEIELVLELAPKD